MPKLALAAVAALTRAAPAAARAAAPAAPTFVPRYMLEEIAKRGNPDQRQRALRQLQRDQAAPSAAEGGPASPQAALLPRGIYDARHTYTLPGVIAWRGPPAALPSDPEVRQGATGQAAVIRFWQFFGPVTLAVPETVHVGQ